MPQFHPPPEFIIDHAVGGLDRWTCRMIDAHADFCAICREALALSRAVGGVLLTALTLVPVSDDEVAGLLACLDEIQAEGAQSSCFAIASDDTVIDVRPLAAGAIRPVPTRDALLAAFGLDQAGLAWPWSGQRPQPCSIVPPGATAAEVTVTILPPAAPLPMPVPGPGPGLLCLILDGCLLSSDSLYQAGDFWSSLLLADAPAGDRAVIAGAQGCLCVIVPGLA